VADEKLHCRGCKFCVFRERSYAYSHVESWAAITFCSDAGSVFDEYFYGFQVAIQDSDMERGAQIIILLIHVRSVVAYRSG
jgi:hypothetical protein